MDTLMADMECDVSHDDLGMAVAAWLRQRCNFPMAFANFRAAGISELPDAFGMGLNGVSVVVEVKVSRSDFLADKKKPFRVKPEEGMGDFRYYCAPQGVIALDELPNGWGLIVPKRSNLGKFTFKLASGSRPDPWGHGGKFDKNIRAEQQMLGLILRRVALEHDLQKWAGGDVHQRIKDESQ